MMLTFGKLKGCSGPGSPGWGRRVVFPSTARRLPIPISEVVNLTDNEDREARIARLRAELAEAEGEEIGEVVAAAEEVEAVAEEVAAEVAEEAREHEEAAEEGLEQAAEAAEAVEEIVEEAAEEAASEVADEHNFLGREEARELIDARVNEILAERHGVELTSHNSPSPAEVAVDVAEDLAEGGAEVAAPVVPDEPMPTPVTDPIEPDSGHWWYRKRGFRRG